MWKKVSGPACLNRQAVHIADSLDRQRKTQPGTLRESFDVKKEITLMQPRFQSIGVNGRLPQAD